MKIDADDARLWVVETLPRSGTHLFQAVLNSLYDIVLLQEMHDGKISIPESKWINKGLYSPDVGNLNNFQFGDADLIFLFRHPHHPPLPSPFATFRRIISLVGFPFDRYVSGGVVAAAQDYSASPSLSRPHGKDFLLQSGSPSCEEALELLGVEASWMNGLRRAEDNILLRYEDFLMNFQMNVDLLTERVAVPKRSYSGPEIVKNIHRTYWSGNVFGRMDESSFSRIFDAYVPALEGFYPEKWPSLLEMRKRVG